MYPSRSWWSSLLASRTHDTPCAFARCIVHAKEGTLSPGARVPTHRGCRTTTAPNSCTLCPMHNAHTASQRWCSTSHRRDTWPVHDTPSREIESAKSVPSTSHASSTPVAQPQRLVRQWYIPHLNVPTSAYAADARSPSQTPSSPTRVAANGQSSTGTAAAHVTVRASTHNDTFIPRQEHESIGALNAANSKTTPRSKPMDSSSSSEYDTKVAKREWNTVKTKTTESSGSEMNRVQGVDELVIHSRSASASTTSQHAHAWSKAASNDDEADERAEHTVHLTRALHRGMSEVNRKRKKLLMAALGSYFATAGLSNDGVNSSFSAIHAQPLLHRLGLPRIPAKLLVSLRTLANDTSGSATLLTTRPNTSGSKDYFGHDVSTSMRDESHREDDAIVDDIIKSIEKEREQEKEEEEISRDTGSRRRRGTHIKRGNSKRNPATQTEANVGANHTETESSAHIPSSSSASGTHRWPLRDWVDISAHPTATLAEYRAALHEVLTGLGIPATVVQGNAEPVQLPQAVHAPHARVVSSISSRRRRCNTAAASEAPSNTSSLSGVRHSDASQTRQQQQPHEREEHKHKQECAECAASDVFVQGLILRYAFDVPGQRKADTFQDLTNRFTLYLMQDRCVTVHRSPCVFVETLKRRLRVMETAPVVYPLPPPPSPSSSSYGVAHGRTSRAVSEEDVSMFGDGHRLVQYFVQEVAATYNRALARCVTEFDNHEARLFSSRLRRTVLARDIYYIKRRASVYARALSLMEEALTHVAITIHMHPSDVGYQETQHEVAHVCALAESINANADSVLQILFQLSSYQVNELMRLLTLFSAFFIPLSFIAAVYGMNFDHLPFLHAQYGELYCVALMCAVTLVIFVWFKINRFI